MSLFNSLVVRPATTAAKKLNEPKTDWGKQVKATRTEEVAVRAIELGQRAAVKADELFTGTLVKLHELGVTERAKQIVQRADDFIAGTLTDIYLSGEESTPKKVITAIRNNLGRKEAKQ